LSGLQAKTRLDFYSSVITVMHHPTNIRIGQLVSLKTNQQTNKPTNIRIGQLVLLKTNKQTNKPTSQQISELASLCY